jgi:hypothetical protein
MGKSKKKRKGGVEEDIDNGWPQPVSDRTVNPQLSKEG